MIRNDLGTVRRGFAFIDMVVAIALTTVLVGLTVPAMEAARQKAAQMDSAENLKKIAVGLHAAHDAHKRLPPAVGFYPMLNVPDKYLEKQPAAHGTVFFHILPFIKQEKVWKDSKGMSHDTKAVIDLYYSEADPSLPPSHKIPDG